MHSLIHTHTHTHTQGGKTVNTLSSSWSGGREEEGGGGGGGCISGGVSIPVELTGPASNGFSGIGAVGTYVLQQYYHYGMDKVCNSTFMY